MGLIDLDEMRARVEKARETVLGDPRRPSATATFCRLYGIPGTRVMDYFAEHGCRLVRADAATFALYERDGLRWHGAAHCALPTHIGRGDLLAEWSVISGATFVFDDTTGVAYDFADVRGLGWRGVASMPVLLDGVAVGALLLGRVGGAPWTATERSALDSWVAMNAILNDRRSQVVSEFVTAGAQANMRFSTIFERAPMGIVIVDHLGKMEAVNAAFSELAGGPPESFVGVHVRDIAVPLENDPSGEYLAEMLAGRRRAYTADRILTRPDGTKRMIRVTTAQLRMPREDEASHLAIVEDISNEYEVESQRREREEQLRQMHKMEAIGQLAGGLAHDFSNTLAAIAGFASLLREDIAEDDPRRQDVDSILRVTQRASGITRRLLKVSEKQVQARATLDLREVLEDFGTLVQPMLPRSVQYALALPDPPAFATIDRMQIEQALLNLAINARDAMPNGGRLTIALELGRYAAGAGERAGRGMLSIHIDDTGTGIPPETLERLWEPFFTTKRSGTGLGLPTSRAILREHGGDLEVQSAPGKGTRFTMILPLAESGAPAAGDGPPALISLAPVATRQTVLLVDDEEAVRVTSRRLLERAGYTVLVGEDGAAGWRVFLANIDVVDIVVTDYIMPEVSGGELMRRVRGAVPDIPVVVTSAYTSDAMNGGGGEEATATLVKPFTGSVLVRTVREVLAKHRRRDRAAPSTTP